jgi:hypothetical protein
MRQSIAYFERVRTFAMQKQASQKLRQGVASGAHHMFRGDGRWLGLSCLPQQRTCFGLCATGSVYVMRELPSAESF